MDNFSKSSSLRRRGMGAAKNLKNDEQIHHIDKLLEQLQKEASISEKDVLGYLDITSKTLDNWRNERSQSATKSQRLERLIEAIENAKKLDVPKARIKQMLVSPINDSADQEGNSIADLLKEEQSNKLVSPYIKIAVEKFAARIRVESGQEIRLTASEFENLLNKLDNPKDPSEHLKSARQRYLKSRIV